MPEAGTFLDSKKLGKLIPVVLIQATEEKVWKHHRCFCCCKLLALGFLHFHCHWPRVTELQAFQEELHHIPVAVAWALLEVSTLGYFHNLLGICPFQACKVSNFSSLAGTDFPLAPQLQQPGHQRGIIHILLQGCFSGEGFAFVFSSFQPLNLLGGFSMPPFNKVVAKHNGWLATFEPTGKERHEAGPEAQLPKTLRLTASPKIC